MSRWDRRPSFPPFGEGTFTSRVRDEKVAAVLGAALGVTFTACFLTGLLSHLIQEPPGWFTWPSRPAGLYRVTQGVHVIFGIASIPLVLAKLWAVYPKLFDWPPAQSFAHAIERLALLPLIGGSLLLLFTGVANINIWRPWEFGFRPGHFWAAWVTMGALVMHVAAKFETSREALLERPGALVEVEPPPGISRRGFLGAAFGASGLLVLFTAGHTVTPLSTLALITPRRPDVGPQGLPINRTAASAGVLESARQPGYRLVVDGPGATRRLELSLADLQAFPQHEAELPIACVEGWSFSARWGGVRVRDLLEMAGARADAEARVHSFQRGDRLKVSDLNRHHAHDRDTLLALRLNGEPLHIEHGFPLRLIGPNRPGVMQTKWVGTLEVL